LSSNQGDVSRLVNLRKSIGIIQMILLTNSFMDSVIAVLDSLISSTTLVKIQGVLSDWFKMLVESYPVTKPNIAFVQSQVYHLNSLPYGPYTSFKVPQQDNGVDCGAFVIHFGKLSLSDPHKYAEYAQVTIGF
jgi:Ulp1 family protease